MLALDEEDDDLNSDRWDGAGAMSEAEGGGSEDRFGGAEGKKPRRPPVSSRAASAAAQGRRGRGGEAPLPTSPRLAVAPALVFMKVSERRLVLCNFVKPFLQKKWEVLTHASQQPWPVSSLGLSAHCPSFYLQTAQGQVILL